MLVHRTSDRNINSCEHVWRLYIECASKYSVKLIGTVLRLSACIERYRSQESREKKANIFSEKYDFDLVRVLSAPTLNWVFWNRQNDYAKRFSMVWTLKIAWHTESLSKMKILLEIMYNLGWFNWYWWAQVDESISLRGEKWFQHATYFSKISH